MRFESKQMPSAAGENEGEDEDGDDDDGLDVTERGRREWLREKEVAAGRRSLWHGVATTGFG